MPCLRQIFVNSSLVNCLPLSAVMLIGMPALENISFKMSIVSFAFMALVILISLYRLKQSIITKRRCSLGRGPRKLIATSNHACVGSVRLFIATIPGCPSWAAANTLVRSLEEMTILFPRSNMSSWKQSSFSNRLQLLIA